eukprot:c1191_g1_i1.p1 GENE.c1191_g1_i1~~c1191_g1_i1.p1  ORF type:complete len:2048 (-),score=504.34 c1191_g1_i1:166-6309(-)
MGIQSNTSTAMHTFLVLAIGLLGSSLVASDRLLGYAGFGHVVVFDKDTKQMAAYDMRPNPASLSCDIMHYPPVAPPTKLTDYITGRNPTNLRLFHTGGEMFTFMDGNTGAYVAYKCEGFRPFLPALPCKVFGIGELPQAAGSKSIFSAGPGRAIIYDSASGEISVHFIDPDVTSGLGISKAPIGYNDKPLKRNLPGVGGDVTIAVATNQNVLLVYKPATRNLKVFHYNWYAGPTDQLLGNLIFEQDNLFPAWVQNILSVENNIIIAYDSVTTQYATFHMYIDASGAFEFKLSPSQVFASAQRGFLQGHACLFDDRVTCLGNEGCGWCASTQSCHHMGSSIPCDVLCESWCSEDNMSCLHKDEETKAKMGPKQPQKLDPSLTSPKDVDSGSVIAERPLFNSTLDIVKVTTGIDFEAPENNSVNCMNAGFKEKSVEEESGCNDSQDKQKARDDTLASTDQMNSFAGQLKVIEKNKNANTTQQPPSEDCFEAQDGVKVDLTHDAPLSDAEGLTAVPIVDGGRWGMVDEVHPHFVPNDVATRTHESDPTRLRDSLSAIPDARQDMTLKRLRRVKRNMNVEPKFAPNQGSTLSGHELMNGKQSRFSQLHVVEDSMLNDGHVTDESILGPNNMQENFVPQQGDSSILMVTQKFVVSGLLVFFTDFTATWESTNGPLIKSALAESAHVSLNDVQLTRISAVAEGISVQYSIDVGTDAEVQSTLYHALQFGEFERLIRAQGFSSHVAIVKHKPSITIAGQETFSPAIAVPEPKVTAADMDLGCDEDGGVLKPSDATDSNFMNGASLHETHMRDEDGLAGSSLVGRYTDKQLESLSFDEIVELLGEYRVDVPVHATKDTALNLLRPLVTAKIATSYDAEKAGAGRGINSRQTETSDTLAYDSNDIVSKIVQSDPLALPTNPILLPLASSEGQSINIPVMTFKKVIPPKPKPIPAFVPAPLPPINMPRPLLPPNGDLAVDPDGTLNTIKAGEASNARGVPIAVDPLQSVIRDPSMPDVVDPVAVNVRDPLDPSKIVVRVGESSPVLNLQLAETEDVATTHEIVFSSLLDTAKSNIGHAVDPLVEYRDLDEADGIPDSPDVGCVSSEDAYTGNSQPRIDYVGDSQIVHMQPLMSDWSVYNISSGVTTSRGALASPYHPLRRSYLGGPDQRYVEHFPVSGGFKFFKCSTGRFENCAIYAQGQWERTVSTNDVIVALTDHLVLLVNEDKGTWRIYNFDRDVSGNSDPFSTAMPPIAVGAFPEFADDEVILLKEGVLLVHDPRTDRIRLFNFDAAKKEIAGPTHEAYLSTEGFHRVTGLGDGRMIVFRPRTKTYRIMGCDETGCSTSLVGYLSASAGMEATPDLRQLYTMDSKTSLSWNGNSGILYVSEGMVYQVQAESSVIENVNPGEFPPTSCVSISQGIIAVTARPKHPNDMLIVVAAGADTTQLMFQRDSVTYNLGVDSLTTYSAGQFSPDGQLFSFTATLLERRVETIPEATGSVPSTIVFVVEVESVFRGRPNPTAVRVYPNQVTLGPFSSNNRYLVVALDNMAVPEDNNLELIDTMSGQARFITALPTGEREPSQWKVDTGAAFHPTTNSLFVISNENVNNFGLQKIDIQSSARTWVLQVDNDITHMSFSEDFSRLSVTFNVDGYAQFHVYLLNTTSGHYDELKRPFLATLKAAPTQMLLSPDGTRMAMSKWTADENGQIYLTKIVELPKNVNMTTEGAGAGAKKSRNATAERLPIVSIPVRITKSRADLPASVMNLAQPTIVTFESFDGIPVSAFVFPPSLKPLFDTPAPLNASRLFGVSATNNTVVQRADPKLTRKPAYVVLIHDGPKDFAAPHLWNSPLAITLNFLRVLGVGVIVPNIRGSSGQGKRFSLLDVQGKRLHAIADVKATRDFLCSGEQIVADCDNIAVAGWAYGGFATLSALAEYPEAWKVGVAGAAISDFKTHFETTRPRSSRDIFMREFGSDPAILERISPVNQAANIRASTLMLHGIGDTVVSVDQAEEMVAALRSRHKDVKYLPITGAGHIITSHTDRMSLGGSVSEFLAEKLGLLEGL